MPNNEAHLQYAGKVSFKTVDVEADGALAAKYGVQSIPTFVIEKDGVEVARRLGSMPKETLTSWLESFV